MSSVHTAAVWMLKGEIGTAPRLVLLCLADHAGYNGTVSMSLSQIADCCDLSVRSVQRVIGALFQAGLINVLDSGFGEGCVPQYEVLCTRNFNPVRDNGVFKDVYSSWGDEPTRPRVPTSVVTAVYSRDGERCSYCGKTEGPFHLDHVIPWSRGGMHTVENLVVACALCNMTKSDRTPTEMGWAQ